MNFHRVLIALIIARNNKKLPHRRGSFDPGQVDSRYWDLTAADTMA